MQPPYSLFTPRASDGYDVKTAWSLGCPFMSLQIVLGRSTQLGLFAGVDGLSRRAVVFGAPVPDFDKYNEIVLLHDQIDLTKRCTVIAFEQLQAVVDQVLARSVFGLMTLVQVRGSCRSHF